MNKRNFSLSQQGMTLIEIMLSIVILGIIAVSFTGFFTQSARTNNQSDQMMDAVYLAQLCIEEALQSTGTDLQFGECPIGKVSTNRYEGTSSTSEHFVIAIKEEKKVIVYVFRDLQASKVERDANAINEGNAIAVMENRLP